MKSDEPELKFSPRLTELLKERERIYKELFTALGEKEPTEGILDELDRTNARIATECAVIFNGGYSGLAS